jgi:hypothetical protein
MQLSIFLNALAAATLASASPAAAPPSGGLSKRGCFSGDGENWGAEKTYALSYAFEACRDFLANPAQYQPGDIRAHCYNLSSLKKVDFALQLRSDVGARTIDYNECYDGLQKEINGCANGGHTQYSNWIYT